MKKISLGFSPCPNDTFIFDAMVNNRIDTGDYKFEVVMEDVEQLNLMAQEGKLDISKISFGAYAYVSKNYVILNSGSALGKGVGPILVSKQPIPAKMLQEGLVAIPGVHTTANLLLSVLFPGIQNKKAMHFAAISKAVMEEEVIAGLLIHEGRFTYESQGLIKLIDLGETWEDQMQLPLPLGCIAANRKISGNERSEIDAMIRQSIGYAWKNPSESSHYIKAHSQEMEDEVIASHIGLYVNEFSVDLGAQGREAILILLKKGIEYQLIPELTEPIFNNSSI
ncbi:MAG: 1,4-dihydroxy-6-naphthoate synthase [Bacteroidetes bacterium]|nr:1,4-dihydroxy-6-naphthoate synthase [Bacteroidota bacterium]